jgi:hypothetical protein
MNRPLGKAFWVLCAAACGGSTGGGGAGASGPVSGTVAGQSFSSGDAAGLVGTITTGGVTANEADVMVSTWSGACSSLMRTTTPASTALLVIAVASDSPVTKGTYDITTNGAVRVEYAAVDASCNPTVTEVAQGGTVTYETIDTSSIVGSVDATFAGGGHVTGTFSAPLCNVSLAAIVSPGTSMTCEM